MAKQDADIKVAANTSTTQEAPVGLEGGIAGASQEVFQILRDTFQRNTINPLAPEALNISAPVATDLTISRMFEPGWLEAQKLISGQFESPNITAQVLKGQEVLNEIFESTIARTATTFIAERLAAIGLSTADSATFAAEAEQAKAFDPKVSESDLKALRKGKEDYSVAA